MANSETAFSHWKNTSIRARLVVFAKVIPVLEEKKTSWRCWQPAKWASVNDAVQLANQHRFGRGAAIFTADLVEGEKIARTRLDAGFAAVNCMVASDPRLPFGGIKYSGYGRELAKAGLLEFVNAKTVIVNR